MNTKNLIRIASLTVLTIFGLLLVFVFLPFLRPGEVTKSPESTTSAKSNTSPPETLAEITSTSIWFGLQQRTPYPYTTPLPTAAIGPIDGTFAKFDESWPQWWLCRRCADYRPAGGIWKLRFDRGVMRIHYNVTGWVSIASYTV